MADLLWLMRAQIGLIALYLSFFHGVPCVDDQWMVSANPQVIRNELCWRDTLVAYRPEQTPYNRFVRWSCLGVFNRIYAGLAGRTDEPERLRIAALHPMLHLTTVSRSMYPTSVMSCSLPTAWRGPLVDAAMPTTMPRPRA